MCAPTAADGKVTGVTFRNVPAFAVHLDVPVEVPTLGTVSVDVAWGGMFYAIADAATLGFRLTPDEGGDIVRVGEMIRTATREQYPVVHPDNPEIIGPTISQLSGPPGSARGARQKRRHRLHRPVGLGQARHMDRRFGSLALRHRDLRQDGDPARPRAAWPESGLSSRGHPGHDFTGRLVEATQVGPYPAVVPTLRGQAWITGIAQYVLDPSDPFPEGFTVGDIWGKSD